MDGMLNERMKQLLADPDALSKVMETASRLFSSADGMGEVQTEEEGRKEAGQAQAASAAPSPLAAASSRPEASARRERTERSEPGEAERMRLLDAICPFLSPQRREAAESMLRILRLLSMAERSGILGSFVGGGMGREG